MGGGDAKVGGGCVDAFAVSASAGRCPGPKLMDASEMRGAGPSSPAVEAGRLKVYERPRTQMGASGNVSRTSVGRTLSSLERAKYCPTLDEYSHDLGSQRQ